MVKKDCYLNHSRNLSTSYKRDNYYYDIERSKATSKQIKFYQKLWYMFKNNNLDINVECDKRGIAHSVIQNPEGRCGYSTAIDKMITNLSENGLYHKKEDQNGEFVNTYNAIIDRGGAVVRAYQKIEYQEKEKGHNEKTN